MSRYLTGGQISNLGTTISRFHIQAVRRRNTINNQINRAKKKTKHLSLLTFTKKNVYVAIVQLNMLCSGVTLLDAVTIADSSLSVSHHLLHQIHQLRRDLFDGRMGFGRQIHQLGWTTDNIFIIRIRNAQVLYMKPLMK